MINGFYPPEGYPLEFSHLFAKRESSVESEPLLDSVNHFLSNHRNALYLLNVLVGATGFCSGMKSIGGLAKFSGKPFPLFKFSFDLSPRNVDRMLIVGGGVLAWGSVVLYLGDQFFDLLNRSARLG